MRKACTWAVRIGAWGLAGITWATGAGPGQALTYPEAKRGEQVDDYHGMKVADPYRWLEDLDSPETRAWVEAENKLTFGWLEQVPERAALRERLTKLYDFERYGVPHKDGGRYFYTRNDGLQNQAVLYVADTLEGTPRVLLDPNTLKADGTMALTATQVSEDGRYLAYGLAEAGSDWNVWKVRDIATGTDTGDELRWIKFSGAAWTKDSKGFFYSRFDEPKTGAELESVNRFQKIYYHALGTPQSADRLIYERKDKPDWYLFGQTTEDGHYLIIQVEDGKSVNNGIFYQDLSRPGAPVVELLNKFDANYTFVGNDGPVFWVQANLDAPRGRIFAIDTARPERAAWKELVPQGGDTIESAGVVGERLLVQYLKDAHNVVRVFELTGNPLGEIALPGLGTVFGLGGRRTDTETFYSFTGFTAPPTVYRYDFASGRSSVFRAPKVDFKPDDFETKQIFYTSKDGTRVPMFIAHKRGLKLDGNNPTLLYGYGGFNVSETPKFSISRVVFMERGGVFALANLRGGGEYGESWHLAGTKLKKQNVFDDFIAAAEWLVANGYTKPRKLAIQGGSNGGLLVGACMAQRPELFGAALPGVGVMDMLRFHKFTVGWGWVGDYGSSDVAEEFKALRAYSPLHNLKPGTCYPPTLVTTADHDDRVYPAHSFKFAAELQHVQGCPNPTLIRIETRAGHGSGKPTAKIIEELADEWAFLVRVLGM
jgi:prolyl oligopeptidase